MSRTLLRSMLVLAGALAAGCSHTFATVPIDPQHASSYGGPAILTATGAPWEGDPDDLTEHLIVVSVDLLNQGQGEVRVAYTDFALTDESGFRYAALNPFVAGAMGGALEAPLPADRAVAREDAVSDGTLVAWRGGRGGVVVRSPMMMRGPRVMVRSPRMGYAPRSYWPGRQPGLHGHWYVRPPRLHPRFGLYGGRWNGFVPGPGLRPWYGPSWAYWHSPFLFGPSAYVWGWSSQYYPSSRPPDDVINHALPEGVLQPNGRLDGYLYFQPPREGASRFALTWNVTDAQTGQPLGQARVDLAVIRTD